MKGDLKVGGFVTRMSLFSKIIIFYIYIDPCNSFWLLKAMNGK